MFIKKFKNVFKFTKKFKMQAKTTKNSLDVMCGRRLYNTLSIIPTSSKLYGTFKNSYEPTDAVGYKFYFLLGN